MTEARL